MFDVSHLPNTSKSDTQVFKALAAADWQVWRKPRGVSMVMMFCLGAGGGGGGGFTGAAGTARGGGGGGGAAGFSTLIIPADSVPDQLFCNVGIGGAAGAPGSAGLAGAASSVATLPLSQITTNLLFSHGTNPGGGGAGTAAAAGAAGAAAGTIGRYPLAFWGVFNSNVGIIGTAGGVQTGAAGANVSGSQLINGGTGGAGTGTANANFAGGNFNGSGWLPTNAGGLAGGGAGNPGFEQFPPGCRMPLGFVGVPGTGGGSSGASGAGGKGGDGGIGCGGGGGGAGVAGGTGGRGGSGLIAIVSW